VSDQDRTKAWGFALFCDDIRVEIGGKVSLMGLYQAEMFFPNNIALPALLPKMVIVVNYYEAHGSLNEDVSFKVTYGDENNVIAEVPVSRRDIIAEQAQAASLAEVSADSERIYNIRLPVTLSPFRIEKMGRFRVRAHYSDGKILRLGSLILRQIPETEFQEMVGVTPTK
jgi:hypothetical protein